MLKKLLENLKQIKQEKHEIKLEKQRNKPELTLGELYVGEIVLQHKRTPAVLEQQTTITKSLKRLQYSQKQIIKSTYTLNQINLYMI